MKSFLYKLASMIIAHLTRICVYDSKKRGECLCKHCENKECKLKQLSDSLEEVSHDPKASN